MPSSLDQVRRTQGHLSIIIMKNRTIILLLLSLFLGIQLTNGQAKKKKLPRNINMLGYKNFGPAISGDGNSMLFMSNFTNDENTAMMFTKKLNASSWKDPQELPRFINIPHLTFANGYCLNFDGSELYFTFKKSGGLGGYDIWTSKLQGDSWAAPQNLGSPLNTSMNDGSPSMSSDGTALYYMSCESMSDSQASGCMLVVSKRKNQQSKWSKAIALSPTINQGNTLSPNILADGETLMFLSDKAGKMQWYMSRMEGDDWLEPIAMDFIDANQQHKISVAAKGRYVFHDVVDDRGSFIEMLLIPEEFKPKDVLRVIGKANYSEGGTLKVYDIESRDRLIFETLSSGDDYDFVLKEGSVYDISFEANDPNIPAVSEILDLTEMKFSTRKKWEANPIALNIGDSLALKSLKFDTVSLSVADQSVYELRRLTRFLSKNQGSMYEISIFHYPLDTATIVDISIQEDSMVVSETIEVADSIALVTSSEIDSLNVLDSISLAIDTVAYREEVVVPTLAENLALSLLQELLSKNVEQAASAVKGITIPLKELEGSEAIANRLFVYLKKKQ